MVSRSQQNPIFMKLNLASQNNFITFRRDLATFLKETKNQLNYQSMYSEGKRTSNRQVVRNRALWSNKNVQCNVVYINLEKTTNIVILYSTICCSHEGHKNTNTEENSAGKTPKKTYLSCTRNMSIGRYAVNALVWFGSGDLRCKPWGITLTHSHHLYSKRNTVSPRRKISISWTADA